MEKIYRQGNAYFDTYYVHAKDGYIGILEHHCRGVKHEKTQAPPKSHLLDFPVFGWHGSYWKFVLDSCDCL